MTGVETEMLPDLPVTFPGRSGKVTGIKCLTPFIVQCSECLHCYTHPVWVIAARLVHFSTKARDLGRLCGYCWASHGFYFSEGDSIRNGDPSECLRRFKAARPAYDINRISVADAKRLIEESHL